MHPSEWAGSAPRAEAADLAPDEYLPFVIGGVACVAPFHALTEVLPGVPPTATLPASPPWLLGVFAHRLHMYGLADPLPMLCGRPDAPARAFQRQRLTPRRLSGLTRDAADRQEACSVIVGTGDHRLALVLDALRPTFTLGEQGITPRADLRTLTDLPFQPRYIGGLASRPGEHNSLLVLEVDTLLRDLLTAIQVEQSSGTSHDADGTRAERNTLT